MIFVAHPYMILFGVTGNVDLKWGAIVARSHREKSTRSEGVLPLHRASTSWTSSTPAPPLDSTLITLLQDQSPPTIHSLYTSARPRQRLTSCPNSDEVNILNLMISSTCNCLLQNCFVFLKIFKLVKQLDEKLLLPWLSQSPDWNLISAESFPLYPVLTTTPPNHLHNCSNNRFFLKNWLYIVIVTIIVKVIVIVIVGLVN